MTFKRCITGIAIAITTIISISLICCLPKIRYKPIREKDNTFKSLFCDTIYSKIDIYSASTNGTETYALFTLNNNQRFIIWELPQPDSINLKAVKIIQGSSSEIIPDFYKDFYQMESGYPYIKYKWTGNLIEINHPYLRIINGDILVKVGQENYFYLQAKISGLEFGDLPNNQKVNADYYNLGILTNILLIKDNGSLYFIINNSRDESNMDSLSFFNYLSPTIKR
jgi:hypothetical protein